MSKTFTDNLKQNYEKACIKNKNQQEFYYCATSSGTTERILDLDSKFVFCKPCSNESKNNEIKEYKLAAFMVREALKDPNNFLPIKGKKWRLLDAERNFAKEDLSEVGKGQRLDLLAYDEQEQSYIVLELKIERSLKKADAELLQYTNTLQNHMEEANKLYSLNAKNVEGYIVWPSNEKPRKNDKPWGLLEYEKIDLNSIENMKLLLVKESSKKV